VITARALGVLMEIASKELYGGAKALSEVFVEGRDACQKSLNELKAAGLTRTTKQKYSNGAYRSIIEITPAGWDLLETRISKVLRTRSLCIQTESYSRLSTNSLYADKQERIPDVVGETEKYIRKYLFGGQMSDYPAAYDPEDIADLRAKYERKKSEEHREAKQKRHEDILESSLTQPKALWSADKSSTEFVQRLGDMWHVKPWVVSKSRFKIAFANARKTHGTDGELELLMMDRYFSQLAHETHINDPEHIWKRFISQFGSLAIDCRRASVTDEDLETAKVSAEKSWEGI
jgi:hypothetical protein